MVCFSLFVFFSTRFLFVILKLLFTRFFVFFKKLFSCVGVLSATVILSNGFRKTLQSLVVTNGVFHCVEFQKERLFSECFPIAAGLLAMRRRLFRHTCAVTILKIVVLLGRANRHDSRRALRQSPWCAQASNLRSPLVNDSFAYEENKLLKKLFQKSHDRCLDESSHLERSSEQ